jgi:hypothetical protein
MDLMKYVVLYKQVALVAQDVVQRHHRGWNMSNNAGQFFPLLGLKYALVWGVWLSLPATVLDQLIGVNSSFSVNGTDKLTISFLCRNWEDGNNVHRDITRLLIPYNQWAI